MAYRRRLKNKKTPEGWQLIEEVIEDFEAQMKEAVNEEHEGKRKNELTWKITRIHWEKNRFIYDLMYKRKVMSRELVGVSHLHSSSMPCHCRTFWCMLSDSTCEKHATNHKLHAAV